MPKCLWCGGRGWMWVGVGSNAGREPCYECDEQGYVPWSLWGAVGIAALITSALSMTWLVARVIGPLMWPC